MDSFLRPLYVPSRQDGLTPATVVNFLRATTATYLGPLNTILAAAINTPRFEGTILVLEGSSTNELLNTELSSGWLNNTPNTAIPSAILGLNGTRVITGSVAGDSPHMNGPAATPAGATMNVSGYADLATIVGTTQVRMTALLVDADGTQSAAVSYSTATGILSGLTLSGANVSNASASVTLIPGTTVARFTVSATFAKSGAAPRVYLFPASGSLVVGGMQIEYGAVPSSYIPSGAAATFRAAESGYELVAGDNAHVVSLSDYTGLITSEHADKPNYMAVVAALMQGSVDQQRQQTKMLADFDLDTAIGAQLDAVGAWVGISRYLIVPLTGVYFTWDDTAFTGWDSGVWQGDFDPATGLASLPDDEYRRLIRAKIAANNWDGLLVSATAIWNQVFNGSQTIIVQDNQDMSMTIGFVGQPLTAVQQALLTGGYFPLKPEGVRIKFYAIPVNTGPLFAWDTNSSTLQGWETGSWAQEL